MKIWRDTHLILKLNIGAFPEEQDSPEDYIEYLCNSDHQLQECEILKVVQGEVAEDE